MGQAATACTQLCQCRGKCLYALKHSWLTPTIRLLPVNNRHPTPLLSPPTAAQQQPTHLSVRTTCRTGTARGSSRMPRGAKAHTHCSAAACSSGPAAARAAHRTYCKPPCGNTTHAPHSIGQHKTARHDTAQHTAIVITPTQRVAGRVYVCTTLQRPDSTHQRCHPTRQQCSPALGAAAVSKEITRLTVGCVALHALMSHLAAGITHGVCRVQVAAARQVLIIGQHTSNLTTTSSVTSTSATSAICRNRGRA
jgi:hypothetical protein